MNLFVALLFACIVIGHLHEEARWMNESITTLSIRLCTGAVILSTSGGISSHSLVLSEGLFFIYLLPPIIFNDGFQVKKKQFFLLFGAVGTMISFTIISLGANVAMSFFKRMNIPSSILFALCRFPVKMRHLYYTEYNLVFREGVVNDAASVVLFNAVHNFDLSPIDTSTTLQLLGNFVYLFVSSTVLRFVPGLLSAYTIKKLYFGRWISSGRVQFSSYW